MRLVYIHKSINAKLKWSGDVSQLRTKNVWLTKDFATDGHPIFLEALLSKGVVDEILVVIESGVSPGALKIGNLDCLVLPNLKLWLHNLRPDDVLYWRGGYRWWWKLLEELPNHWHLYYGAGTPRGGWPQWDVILWEGKEAFEKRGKLYLPWNKPINTNIFKPVECERPYDVCIGASRIFDIKQQFKTIDALLEYRKQYGEDLNCVMPGAVRRSTQTTRVLELIKKEGLKVHLPGWLSRTELSEVFNQSKLMTHHASGLNDRCVLEALACGLPLLSISEGGGRYPQWVKDVRLLAPASDPSQLAQTIHDFLKLIPNRETVYNAFNQHNNLSDTVDNLKKLFPLLTYPKDRKRLVEEYLCS